MWGAAKRDAQRPERNASVCVRSSLAWPLGCLPPLWFQCAPRGARSANSWGMYQALVSTLARRSITCALFANNMKLIFPPMRNDISRTHRPSRTQPSTRDAPDHELQIRHLQSTRPHAPGGAQNGRSYSNKIQAKGSAKHERGGGSRTLEA
jgi:hypothetical protein